MFAMERARVIGEEKEIKKQKRIKAKKKLKLRGLMLQSTAHSRIQYGTIWGSRLCGKRHCMLRE